MRAFFGSNQLHQVYRGYIEPIYKKQYYFTALQPNHFNRDIKTTKMTIQNSFNKKALLRLKKNSKTATLENYISLSC